MKGDVVRIYNEYIMNESSNCYIRPDDAKWQKTTENCQNQPKIKGKIRLFSRDNFLVAVVFEIIPGMLHKSPIYDYFNPQKVCHNMLVNIPIRIM